MTFRLKIDCDNAAFEGDQLTEEIARLLARAAALTSERDQQEIRLLKAYAARAARQVWTVTSSGPATPITEGGE